VRDEVVEAMARALRDCPGNPSSVHAEGGAARAEVERARERVASLLGAEPGEVIFTSGATESNNTALDRIGPEWGTGKRHIVATNAEHPSVEAPLAPRRSARRRRSHRSCGRTTRPV
jgi:cysteine desulfurase